MKYLKIILSQLYISKSLPEKLKHNFHELTILEKVLYFIFIRLFFDKEKRFFFEGSIKVPGQMYIADRKALYDVIVKNKPKQCFEIGTYTGGGSTYFLASAFHKIGSGKIITLENNKELYDRAVNFYKKRLPHLMPYVEFVFGDSVKDFEPYLNEDKKIDCVFLDGAEDGKQTKQQYLDFQDYYKKDTILMMHDWNTEKTVDLKPIMESNNDWEKILEIEPPASVGFAAFKRK